MAAQVTAICGPARTGKTDRLLARYRACLATAKPGSALWIAPTHRGGEEIRRRLLDASLPGCFSPGIVTFAGFAELVLSAAPVNMRPISSHIRRRLIARLIRRAHQRGQLPYFGPIAHTDGLVDQVTEWISELKRLEVWPEHFAEACSRRGGLSAKDRELIAIYQEYQDALNKHVLYDQEGRFWSARELLERGTWEPVAGVRLVVVDGFSDFTDTQHDILQLLAGRAEELLITLPLEQDTHRADLFAGPALTLAELQKRHPHLAVEHVARAAKSRWPTLDHIERRLFCAPQHAEALPQAEGVEILAASQRLGEVQLVGRRIKELLTTHKVRPGEIAVVFRSLSEVEPLVREVFTELGLPFYFDADQPLRAAPALGALVALMRLHVEDWPFRQLLALLTNNYFQPQWAAWDRGRAAVAAERVVRTLQVPRGRETLLAQGELWRRRLEQRVGELGDDDPAALAETQRRLDEVSAALDLLQQLSLVLSKLPQTASIAEWGQAWSRLASETGISRVVLSQSAAAATAELAGVAARDRAGLNHLFAVLSGGDRLAEWLDEPPQELDARGALDELLDVLRSESLPQAQREEGRVRVISAMNARTLDIPYLFVAGLSEKSFPQHDRDGMYTEAETRRLAERGIPLASRVERSQAEMLLFYELVTRSSRRLYLSYPALDEKAQPLSPSSYLLEVERACGVGVLPRFEEPDLSPLPRTTAAQSAVDLRLLAVKGLLAGEPEMMASMMAHPPRADLIARLEASIEMNHARQRGETFGRYEGVFDSASAEAVLAAQFGPQHAWSASLLETYAYCPFRFFAGNVLGLAPLAELALEVDYGARGALLHAALAHIHRELHALAADRPSPSSLDVEDFLLRMDAALQKLIADERVGNALEQAQREVDRRTLARWARNYHEQHTEYDKCHAELERPLQPAHFEVRFGPRRRSDAHEDELSTDECFEISLGEETLRLTGRIDRIDRGVVCGQAVFSVLDYKSGRSGRVTVEDVEAGLALQLPLYTMAAEALLLKQFGEVPWQAGYWVVRDRGFNPKHALTFSELQADRLVPSEAWLTLREKVLQRIATIVAGIRGGAFPMFSPDEHCTSRCDFRTACRVNQARSLEKMWPAPAETSGGEGCANGERAGGDGKSGASKRGEDDGSAVRSHTSAKSTPRRRRNSS